MFKHSNHPTGQIDFFCILICV